MTVAEPLIKASDLTDDEWAFLASRLLTVRFPDGRPDQHRPDGDWSLWLVMAGRGWGKTRVGAEDVVNEAIENPGDYFVCAPTFRDMRVVCVEGKSGVLNTLRRRCVGHDWNISTTTVALDNGSKIFCGSADEPDRWRGYNFRGGWCDEVGAWRRPDTLTQLRLATRIGDHPRIVLTTTPRMGSRLVADLLSEEGGPVCVTRGRTVDNAANLSAEFLDEMERTYGGTRLGRQELEGEFLTDVPGALWSLADIDAARVAAVPPFDRVVVAIDPAATSGEDSDLTGIVAVARSGDDLFVLADRSGRYTPDGWGRVAVGLADEVDADRVVGEVNNGGEMIENVLRQVDRNVAYRAVRASRGKRVRAEPVAALYEQHRVHHVGAFGELEDQLCSWTPDAPGSPDRMDALVWAISDLTERRGRGRVVVRQAA